MLKCERIETNSLSVKLRRRFKLFKLNNKPQTAKRKLRNSNLRSQNQMEAYLKDKFLKKDILALSSSIYENMKNKKQNSKKS